MSLTPQVLAQLATQAIELPSWAFGNSGTRFRVFTTPGTPRTIEEKIADAAQVHAATGLAPSVALHGIANAILLPHVMRFNAE